MSFFSYAVGTLILILVLLRQVRVRPVPRVFQPRLPVVIGVIGLLEMFSYAGNHHVSSTAWLWVAGSLVVGALGVGRPAWTLHARLEGQRLGAAPGQRHHHGPLARVAARAFRGRRRTGPRGGGRPRGGELPPLSGCDAVRAVLRRVPPGSAALGAARAGRRTAAATAVHPVARRLLRRLHRTGRWPGARGQGQPAPGSSGGSFADDRDIIDAEVVEDEDDHGPPELHAPR